MIRMTVRHWQRMTPTPVVTKTARTLPGTPLQSRGWWSIALSLTLSLGLLLSCETRPDRPGLGVTRLFFRESQFAQLFLVLLTRGCPSWDS